MGVKSNVQSRGVNEYTKSLFSFLDLYTNRANNPLLWPNWIWMATPSGRKMAKDLKVMHKFTRTVVENRWSQHQIEVKSEKLAGVDKGSSKKSRVAFLGESRK